MCAGISAVMGGRRGLVPTSLDGHSTQRNQDHEYQGKDHGETASEKGAALWVSVVPWR